MTIGSSRTACCGWRASCGADPRHISAYLIIAHPGEEQQEATASMHFAHQLGIRLALSEFSPIPGTPDGERCRQWVDLDEPLWHNKTAFPLAFLGAAKIHALKDLAKRLNSGLPQASRSASSSGS